jgi:hypothetical protein
MGERPILKPKLKTNVLSERKSLGIGFLITIMKFGLTTTENNKPTHIYFGTKIETI